MSLKMLNDDFQLELEAEQKEATKTQPMASVVRRFKSNSLGTKIRGEYPTSQRLEELLLGFE